MKVRFCWRCVPFVVLKDGPALGPPGAVRRLGAVWAFRSCGQSCVSLPDTLSDPQPPQPPLPPPCNALCVPRERPVRAPSIPRGGGGHGVVSHEGPPGAPPPPRRGPLGVRFIMARPMWRVVRHAIVPPPGRPGSLRIGLRTHLRPRRRLCASTPPPPPRGGAERHSSVGTTAPQNGTRGHEGLRVAGGGGGGHCTMANLTPGVAPAPLRAMGPHCPLPPLVRGVAVCGAVRMHGPRGTPPSPRNDRLVP